MAVYYKFKSAKDFELIPIEGHFITVGQLKDKIFESKQLGRGKDFDLVVINAQTNEEYLDEAALIPKSSSVVIRRLPGPPPKPIVAAPVTNQEEQLVENRRKRDPKTSFVGAGQFPTNHIDDLNDDDFGEDIYNIPEAAPVISGNPGNPPSKAEEDRNIESSVNAPALDWQQAFYGFGRGRGRGFGCGMGGLGIGGHGFGRSGFERQQPPEGYVCHRCKMPGHFIQHCPTNGHPNFDIMRMKPPTSIPKYMLVATPDGSYRLPNDAVAFLEANAAASKSEIEGMPTMHNVTEVPPELHCPLCKRVMEDAVITSKCCFRTFCGKCIREQIISEGKCACGATDTLADNLLPNHTFRDTIMRILGTKNCDQSISETTYILQKANIRDQEGIGKEEESLILQREALGKGKTIKVLEASETKNDSRNIKDKHVKAKKKKKKKAKIAEMQWTTSQDYAVPNYMTPAGLFPYNPYWNGMHPGYRGFAPQYGPGPLNVPIGVPAMMPPQIPPHSRVLSRPQREIGKSGDVSSMNLKSVRNLVVNMFFILSTYCITCNFMHSGSLSAKYMVDCANNKCSNMC